MIDPVYLVLGIIASAVALGAIIASLSKDKKTREEQKAEQNTLEFKEMSEKAIEDSYARLEKEIVIAEVHKDTEFFDINKEEEQVKPLSEPVPKVKKPRKPRAKKSTKSKT
jgi:hypothetical protein